MVGRRAPMGTESALSASILAKRRREMRITLINQYYPPDIAPTAHLAASLAEHRAALGDEVRVVTGRGGYVPTITGDSRSREVLVRRLWTSRRGKQNLVFRSLDYLAFYLQAAIHVAFLPRQDLIISLTTPPLIGLIAQIHRLFHKKTKIILWNMDVYPDAAEAVGVLRTNGIASRVCRRLAKLQLSGASHVVALDRAMHDRLCRQMPGSRRTPITVIPNWERLTDFPPTQPGSSTQEMSPQGRKDSRFTVLYLGNMGYGHSFTLVLTAAKELQRRPIRFLFVGGGKRWPEVAEAKASDGLENVEMLPYVPKESTPAIMASADCALITLHDWALGIMSPSKLHACLAMGLPVLYVGPQHSNVDEAITEFHCGVSLRSGDLDGFLAFTTRCAADSEFLEGLRRNARQVFESRYCDAAAFSSFDRLISSSGALRNSATHRSFSNAGELAVARMADDLAPGNRN